ncbi:MAG: hypothetical protein K5764_09505 [Prevotella sp.]|nr:hypothetical protein [Prevotella sp.]
MIIDSFPRKAFLEIEPLLYKLYGIDTYCLNNAIHFAKEELFNNPEESKVDSESFVYLPLSAKYSYGRFVRFCKKHKIAEDSIIAKVLHFVYKFFPIENPQLMDNNYLEYGTFVRPEMLRLYMILHGGKERFRKRVTLTFGRKSVTVDANIPWLQMELERYLDKYLGVKNVAEAEEELKLIYGVKAGPKQNTEMSRVIWGTFHLLNMSEKNRVVKVKSVSNAHSKLVSELLILMGWLPKPESDGEHVRALMNYYRKKFKTIEELITVTQYRQSPNRDMNCY